MVGASGGLPFESLSCTPYDLGRVDLFVAAVVPASAISASSVRTVAAAAWKSSGSPAFHFVPHDSEWGFQDVHRVRGESLLKPINLDYASTRQQCAVE